MKKGSRRKLNITLTIVIILLVATLLQTSENSGGSISWVTSGAHVSASNKKDVDLMEEETAYGENISMLIDYGYDHYAKYGRNMSVSASITNEGKAFKGWLQVIVLKAEKNVVYRKEIKINSLSTEELDFTIPVVDDTGRLQVRLVDMNGNTIVEKICKIKIGNHEEQTYIGVLSDETEKLEYLNTLATKVFYLDESMLPDNYLGLDLLDILIINQYDTNRLNDKKLDAINNWVIQGGTLVIGTGEYAEQTLAKLGATYAIETSGVTENHDITFGVNKGILQDLKQDILDYEGQRKLMLDVLKNRNITLESFGKEPIVIENTMSEQWAKESIDQLKIVTLNKKIIEAHIESGNTEVIENNIKLMQVRSMGSGVVQLFSFDMGLDIQGKPFGVAMLASMKENMSNIKKAQLQSEYYGTYLNYRINSSMTYTDAEKVPKIAGYIIVLVIYIVLVGPATYLILKKLDKRSLTWFVVPVFALVFTLIVYFLGSGTRINEPYIGYVELLTFQEDNTVKDEVYLGLTAPYNHKYTVEINSKYPVTELASSNYNYYMNDLQAENETNFNKYMAAINVGINKTILEVNNNPAFSPVYYKTQNTYAMENQLTYDIKYLGGDIDGTVTNGFDYDLSNAILMSSDYLIHIGAIKQGETVSLEGKEKVFLATRDIFYNSDIINRVAGGTGESKDNTAEMNRKANVLYHLGESKLLVNPNSSYVVGFVEEDTTADQASMQNSLITDLSQEMNSYGTKVVVIPVQVDNTKENQTIVPSIDSYMKLTDTYYDLYYSYRFLDSENKVVEYQFPEGDRITSVHYLKSRNLNIDSEYQRAFDGTVYFLNTSTGNFDEIFRSGAGGKLSNLENYVTDQNTITLRFSTDSSLQGYQMLLPYISYWKEANPNADN